MLANRRDNNRIQRLGVPGVPTCGDPLADVSERLVLSARGTSTQRFRRNLAILTQASCDRPCTITVTGWWASPGVAALKLRRQTNGPAPLELRVALGERDTDLLLAALRRRKRVTATLRIAAVDLRGRRASRSLRVRLR